MRGAGADDNNIPQLCFHFQVVGKVYKEVMCRMAIEEAGAIDIASGTLHQRQ